jgi:hypothetical protein
MSIIPKTYVILTRAIEDGVGAGWRYAHKHTDAPTAEHIKACIEEYVMASILEVFDIPETVDYATEIK